VVTGQAADAAEDLIDQLVVGVHWSPWWQFRNSGFRKPELKARCRLTAWATLGETIALVVPSGNNWIGPRGGQIGPARDRFGAKGGGKSVRSDAFGLNRWENRIKSKYWIQYH
jgi:hypothetical protein